MTVMEIISLGTIALVTVWFAVLLMRGDYV